MSTQAIQVEGLSKRYQIGTRLSGGYKTLREAIVHTASAPFRALRERRAPTEQFWALKDVSFDVLEGEVLGIIGSNGAGKSTLLKLLARITEPTAGRALVHGRIASLLEVGTGFHPELTGRDNVYLNGAILGMKRREVDRKFDEIVAFADVEKFLDTPIKRYSSGMHMRLAFAVASHLEPEILLIDEVLAVGDAGFQKKCLGKMGTVASEGRTVLFVSHNMAAVSRLCTRAVLLQAGRVARKGATGEVISDYFAQLPERSSSSIAKRSDRQGSGALRFVDLVIESPSSADASLVQLGDTVKFRAVYESGADALRNVFVAFGIYNDAGQHIFMCSTRVVGQDMARVPATGAFSATVPALPLMPGRYSINLYCEVSGALADHVCDARTFDVVEGDFFGTGYLPPLGHGGVAVPHEWEIEGPSDELRSV